jgi:hypothetical protein
MHWSQPEIALYDDNPKVRISYPDFIEQNGKYFITETEKETAYVHELDPKLLEGMWNQFDNSSSTTKGFIADLSGSQCCSARIKAPYLTPLNQRAGVTLEFFVKFNSLEGGQILFDSLEPNQKGIRVSTTPHKTIEIMLSDGHTSFTWDCDRNLLTTMKTHHIVIIVDGGPKIVTFLVDGILCDGGDERQFGWGRFDNTLSDINGNSTIAVCSSLSGEMKLFRLYDRYLRTSEAVANFKS